MIVGDLEVHESNEVNAKMADLTQTPLAPMAHLEDTIGTPVAYSSTIAMPMAYKSAIAAMAVIEMPMTYIETPMAQV